MRNAPLWRRLAAMLYDGLLVLALLFIGTLPFIATRGGEPVESGNIGYRVTMLLIAWAFFSGFWTQRGRTLGMQSWRLHVETLDGQRPGLAVASARFASAILSWLPLGLGFLWQLIDRDNLTWHDRLSGTRLKYLPKEKKDCKKSAT